jgi:ribonuclease-3
MVRPSGDAERAIGYSFRRPGLLDQALTHKSHLNEARDKSRKDNQRLEFLGDAVLALLVSEYLAEAFPDSTEGELSKLKAQLVSEPVLAQAARRLDLGSLLRLGRGEELTQGRHKHSLLADALESIIAAVYLDGGLEPAREFILRALAPELDEVKQGGGPAVLHDYKTQFQEWCQKRHDTLPRYSTLQEKGPDHEKTFEVQLSVRGEVLGVGTGRTKKEAEQMAARQALEQVREKQ